MGLLSLIKMNWGLIKMHYVISKTLCDSSRVFEVLALKIHENFKIFSITYIYNLFSYFSISKKNFIEVILILSTIIQHKKMVLNGSTLILSYI